MSGKKDEHTIEAQDSEGSTLILEEEELDEAAGGLTHMKIPNIFSGSDSVNPKVPIQDLKHGTDILPGDLGDPKKGLK